LNIFLTVAAALFLLITVAASPALAQDNGQWDALQVRFHESMSARKYQEALAAAQEFETLVKSRLGQTHTGYGGALIYLGQANRALGRLREAEALYDRAITIFERTLGKAHPTFALALVELANAYQFQRRLPEAERICKQALQILEKAVGENNPRLLPALDTLVNIYSEQGRMAEAETITRRTNLLRAPQQARSECVQRGGARALINEGQTLYHQGSYGEAEKVYRCAVELFEKGGGGPTDSDLGDALRLLADVYKAQDRLAEAGALYTRSQEILEATDGSGAGLAITLNNHCALELDQGQFEVAEVLCQRAITIWQGQLAKGQTHAGIANTFKALTLVYEAQARYAAAEELVEQARALNLPGWSSSSKRPPRDDIAVLAGRFNELIGASKREDALAAGRRLEARFRQEFGTNHHLYFTLLSNLAVLLLNSGEHAAARLHLLRALLEARSPSKKEVDFIEMDRLTLVLLLNEDLKSYSVAHWSLGLGKQRPHIAIAVNNLGTLHTLRGQPIEAENQFTLAHTILEKDLGPDHFLVGISLFNLAQVKRTNGRNNEANALLSRAGSILKGNSR
jgi:tetratricopeptide (TPR) repeat protein